MNKIKLMREKKKMSQYDLAVAVSVGRSTVAMWEIGVNSPTADKLVKVADVLGCTVDELLREEKKEVTDRG